MSPRGTLLRHGRACGRILAGSFYKWVYASDAKAARSLVRGYWLGEPRGSRAERSALDSLRLRAPGLECSGYMDGLERAEEIPFVFERPDTPALIRLREAFGLEKIASGPGGEYQAILRLGEWLGSRWDHGTDEVAGGLGGDLDAAETIRLGMQGKRYWCEVAARVAVQAFASLGWPARLATASRDGYVWEHGICEVWSGEHSKWIALDTDFNMVYESAGIPLSCYEICHDAPGLRDRGLLSVRRLGADKASLAMIDLLPYYAYVHIDMRSDWVSRRLRRGSPAGGDAATWWTARPEFGSHFSPKKRVDARARFDWPVNIAWTRLERVEYGARGGSYEIGAALCAYAPYPARYEMSLNGGEWRTFDASITLALPPGEHALATRVVPVHGWPGRAETLRMRLPPAP